ncbi:hypothetical protein ACA910_022414 [Epithemia clementina (nom. ined.)]
MSDIVVGNSNSQTGSPLPDRAENNPDGNSQTTIAMSKENNFERESNSISSCSNDEDKLTTLEQNVPNRKEEHPFSEVDLLLKVSGCYMSITRLGHQKNISLFNLYQEFLDLEIGNFEGCPIDGGFAGLEKGSAIVGEKTSICKKRSPFFKARKNLSWNIEES